MLDSAPCARRGTRRERLAGRREPSSHARIARLSLITVGGQGTAPGRLAMAVAPQPLTVIGQRVPRLDAGEKVTGAAEYVADIKLPGMLVGKILRSPLAHARIVRIDTSRARAVTGVRAVITAADAPAVRWGAWTKDQYPLATGKVRYIGEEVAAVAAVDAEAAEEAVRLIEVEYEELPAVFDPVLAMQEGAPVLHDERPDNVALVIDVERGDVEAAFARADLIVEETFQSALQWPAPI